MYYDTCTLFSLSVSFIQKNLIAFHSYYGAITFHQPKLVWNKTLHGV